MKKIMIKKFQKLQGKRDLWTVYNDFLMFAAICISNSVDIVNRTQREKQFLEVEKRYTKEEMQIFGELLGALTVALNKPGDVLGELLMELDLGSKLNGQFFTPYHLCELTAQLAIDKDKLTNEINEKGYTTLNEPSVGGGAMVIAFAEAMKELGFNPQKELIVTCNDLDIKSVYMTYIQLSLLGIPAIVEHMNTLSLEKYSTWKTPGYYLRTYW